TCRTRRTKVETQLQLRHAKGGSIPVSLSSMPIACRPRDGGILYQTAIVDLTKIRQAEAEIRTSEERYRTLFGTVPVAVYTCDASGFIREYNDRAVALWGRQPGRNGSREKFCGSFKIFYSDGRPMPHERCPMARLLRGEKLKPSDL